MTPRRTLASLALVCALAVTGCLGGQGLSGQVAPSTATPTPSETSTSGPTASPPVSLAPGELPPEVVRAIEDFLVIRDQAFISYHERQDGQMWLGDATLGTFKWDADVSDDRIHFRGTVLGIREERITIGDASWVKRRTRWVESNDDPGFRTRIEDYEALKEGGADVELVETYRQGGQWIYHLRSTTPEAYDFEFDEDSVTGSLTQLDVLLREDGTPYRIEFEFEATASEGGLRVRVRVVSRSDFTRFGEEIVIEPPDVAA
jgi:hypothetical protein